MTSVEQSKSIHGSCGFRILAVIPTLGQRPQLLARTLASIRSQEDVEIDIIVVGNLAVDVVSKLALTFNATVVKDPGGISAAVNAGFGRATFEHRYVFWLGDDDLLRPQALKQASTALERDSKAVVAFGDCDYVDIEERLLFCRKPPPMASWLLQFVPGLIKQEACIFRRSAIEAVGRLDENLRLTMDLDLLLKLRRVGRFVRVKRVQAAFCWHAGSLTISNRKTSLDEAQAVQRRNVRGPEILLFSLLRWPIRWLMLFMSARINRRMVVR